MTGLQTAIPKQGLTLGLTVGLTVGAMLINWRAGIWFSEFRLDLHVVDVEVGETHQLVDNWESGRKRGESEDEVEILELHDCG